MRSATYKVSHPAKINGITFHDVDGQQVIVLTGAAFNDNEINGLFLRINLDDQITDSEYLKIAAPNITTFPNPSKGTLQLTMQDIPTKEPLTIRLFTSSMQLIENWQIDQADSQLSWETNLSQVPAGTYYLEINTGNFRKVMRWLKL